MEKKSTSSVLKLAVSLIVCLAFGAIDRFVFSHPVLRVIAMAALLLSCA